MAGIAHYGNCVGVPTVAGDVYFDRSYEGNPANDFRAELIETLKGWDFLLINDSEARLLSGESNLRGRRPRFQAMGPRTLVVKRGEYGAVLFRGGSHFMAPGYLLEKVFDPTGAGDCFAGGFMGYLAGRGVAPTARRSILRNCGAP